MNLLRRELRLLWAGLAATAISLIFGLTPLQWWIERRLWGVADHYYPELMWLLFALPLSLGILIGGAVSAWIALGLSDKV